MSERVLNAVLVVKDTLKYYHNKPELVPISNKLIALGQTAYRSYQNYVDNERMKKEEIKKKNKVEDIKIQEKATESNRENKNKNLKI
jgi:uncharacterized membrane protein YebE (DUF533 family)